MRNPLPTVFDYFLRGGLQQLLGSRDLLVFYYTEKKNFGDLLNNDIFQYFGRKIHPAALRYAEVVGLGSVLQGCLLRSGQQLLRRTLHVCGAGFGQEGSVVEKFRRPVTLHAVRGRLTLERCQRILSADLTDVTLGDPGLLVRRIFSDSVAASPKTDLVGVVCHMVDVKALNVERINLKRHRVKFIDVSQKTSSFVREVAMCSCVFSSAMHPLICADALNIPNMRLRLSDNLVGGDYKFNDYYSVFKDPSRGDRTIDLRNDSLTDAHVEALLNGWVNVDSEVSSICDQLTFAFQRMLRSFA